MKCSIDGIYKAVKEVKSGSFINEKGETINYKGGYKLIFDQYINSIPKETDLKIDKEIALNIQPSFKPYDRIVINFDILIYSNNNISVKILGVEKK